MQTISSVLSIAFATTGLLLAACGSNNNNNGDGSSPDAHVAAACNTGSDACDVCADHSCCAQIDACNGNSQCEELLSCEDECASGNQTCLDACTADYPGGLPDLNALSQCLTDDCDAQCTAAAPAVNPVGTWTMTLYYSANSCMAAGTGSESFTVTAAGSGWDLYEPGSTFSNGTMNCTSTGCALDQGETYYYDSVNWSEYLILQLSSTGAITGNGTIVGDGCTEPFTVSGSKN